MDFDHLSSKVFGTKLILECILSHMAQSDNDTDATNNLSTQDIQTCRLVNQTWLATINDNFRISKKPVFRLRLNARNSLNSSQHVQQNGKLLDNFFARFAPPSVSNPEVPTFSIKATETFFRQENYESFLDCLTRCGSSLISIDIQFPRDGGSMTYTFPNVHLPNIQTFSIKFLDGFGGHHNNVSPGERVVVPEAGTLLIQQILFGCPNLAKLEIVARQDMCLPPNLEQVVLPTNIRTLICPLSVSSRSHFHFLTGVNVLSNLTRLDLHYTKKSREFENMFTLLDRVKDTLRELNIYDDDYNYAPVRDVFDVAHSPYEPVLFWFPVMQKLEELSIRSLRIRPLVYTTGLEYIFPKLRKYYLLYMEEAVFRRWTENSRFGNVVQLEACVVDAVYNRRIAQYYESFTEVYMQIVLKSFPKIKTLDIIVRHDHLSGLEFAFKKLQTLKVLKVQLKNPARALNSDVWDALLIGISVGLTAALRKSQSWDHYSDFRDKSCPSIRLLTELEELHLRTGSRRNIARNIISDAAFDFAFLKMPRLRKLVLGGRFRASPEARQKWESKGRLLK